MPQLRSPSAAIQMEHSQKGKTEKTCKHRARYVKVKTRWGQIKHLKLWWRLPLDREPFSLLPKGGHMPRSVQSTACPGKRSWLSKVIWLLLELRWWDVTSPALGGFCLRLKPVPGGRVRGPSEDTQHEGYSASTSGSLPAAKCPPGYLNFRNNYCLVWIGLSFFF